jgi:hypothetical protein
MLQKLTYAHIGTYAHNAHIGTYRTIYFIMSLYFNNKFSPKLIAIKCKFYQFQRLYHI